MRYPTDILNPDSLADVLVKSCSTETEGGDTIFTIPPLPDRFDTLVRLLVMYIPLDHYDKVLDEWAAQPEGKNLHEVIRAVVDDCGHCEELRVVGPDHRNTRDASHDEGCETENVTVATPFGDVEAIRGKKPLR